MQEHDTTENGGASNKQSPEDQNTVRHAMKLFKKAKKHRAKYDKNWLHYYKLFRGDQWDGVKMPRFRQQECVNMIWQTIQSNLPLQTDVRPKLTFIPEDPTDTEFTEILNQVAEHDWEAGNWLAKMTEVVLDGYLYGHGISSMGYDPNAQMGMGSAEYNSEDPFYIYPDPECSEINDKKSEYIIKAEPVDTDRLKKAFPHLKDEIKSDITDILRSSKTSLNDYKALHQATDKEMPDMIHGYGGETSSRTLLITVYMKPEDTEEVEEETDEVDDENNPKTETVVQKKYPAGRKVVIASGLMLAETALPFQHGNFPFSKYINYILPREFFGVSEIEQLESPQKVFNKLINASLEVLNYMGNPIWITDTSSGVDPHKLVNRTGLVVEKEPGSEVRREAGVQLSGTALSLIDRFETWFNNVAGTQDVSRGQTPGSVTASSAIEQLMDASRTRIKQKQRNLDAYLRDVGRQWVDVVLEKYSAPRIVRVTNDDEDAKFFKVSISQPQGEEKVNAIVQKFNKGEDGVFVADNDLKQMYISGRFDVRVNTGSSLPFAIADKENRVLALFDRQILDAKEVLEQMKYPNKEEILQRLKEREAELAAQQQQGGQ